tara:strand:- start:1556 stop:1768 length:213 start_codon:yes stop_codon:yes gene_type:complete
VRIAIFAALLSMSCGGVQAFEVCAVSGKLLGHLSTVAEFACGLLGGDSEKCGRAVGALDVASDVAALCSP